MLIKIEWFRAVVNLITFRFKSLKIVFNKILIRFKLIGKCKSLFLE